MVFDAFPCAPAIVEERDLRGELVGGLLSRFSYIRRCSLLFVVLLLLCSRPTVRAASASPTVPPSASPVVLNVTREQALNFLTALQFELSPNSGKVRVKDVPASQLPAYDPLVHYAGLQDGAPLIIISTSAKGSPQINHAIGSAFALAVMDDEEAGSLWKHMYDEAAAADAGLPADAADPYLHRHALADAALTLVEK